MDVDVSSAGVHIELQGVGVLSRMKRDILPCGLIILSRLGVVGDTKVGHIVFWSDKGETILLVV